MTDVLADRCAELADVTLDLFRAVMECQNNVVKLPEVLVQIERMRPIVDKGTEGISRPEFVRWQSTATSTLDEMEASVARGDFRGVWAAFTHPVKGMDGLGQGCSGFPRW